MPVSVAVVALVRQATQTLTRQATQTLSRQGTTPVGEKPPLPTLLQPGGPNHAPERRPTSSALLPGCSRAGGGARLGMSCAAPRCSIIR